MSPPIPLTRQKGEIACFSCFAKNSAKVNVNSKLPQTQTLENLTEIIQIIQKGGMNVPILVNRCEDTIPILNPNFYGANIHICPNSDEEPGACVKLKGYYKGKYLFIKILKDYTSFQEKLLFIANAGLECGGILDHFVIECLGLASAMISFNRLLNQKKIQYVFVKMIFVIPQVPYRYHYVISYVSFL